ncbi:MAG: cytochrome c [Acidobacteriota bacterium]
MRVLKTALVISSAVLFSIACSTSETTNHNANQSAPTAAANTNTAPASASANVNSGAVSPASATANTSQPAKTADEKKKDDKASTAKPASNIDAAALFTSNKCATCHGADGKGKIKGARDFTDAAWQKKESDAELAAVIKNGKKPMPPYGDKLKEDEIRALVAYVRSFAKK